MNRRVFGVAVAAGGLLSSAALAQQQRPIAHRKPAAPRVHGARQTLTQDRVLHPVRVASVMPNGRGGYVMTSPWKTYTGNFSDAPDYPVFDAFEGDALGNPTGFCSSGCNQLGNCPGAPEDSRWFGGPTYNNPHNAHDFTVRSGSNGAHATAANFAVNWAPLAPTQLFLIVNTYEDFSGCDIGGPPLSNALGGVVLDFGVQPAGAGYYTLNADLTADALFWQMPADGTGGYELVIANAYDPNTNVATLELSPGTQPMLWGTGDHETPPDGRVGTQGPWGYDDDNPTDGSFASPDECYNYAAGAGQCPTFLAPSIEFLSEPPAGNVCYPNCDHSTTIPFLNVLDFNCFLNAFSSGQTYANCDNSTTPPILNVLDFNCFLNKFSAGCSAP